MMTNNTVVYLIAYPDGRYEIFQNKDNAIQACLEFCENDENDTQFYEAYKDAMSCYFPDRIDYIMTYEEWLIDNSFDAPIYGIDFPKIYEQIIK